MALDSESLAKQLEAVLEGALPLEAILEDPKNFAGSMSICFHGLHHFLADRDIREKDSAYRLTQENEMRKLICLLRSGADDQALSKITFLGASDGAF